MHAAREAFAQLSVDDASPNGQRQQKRQSQRDRHKVRMIDVTGPLLEEDGTAQQRAGPILRRGRICDCFGADGSGILNAIGEINIMVRSELISQLASEYPDITHRQIIAVVDAVFDGITDALSQGHRVEFRGFGTFAPKQRGGRLGRNPKTGERVQVEPKQIASFRASKVLQARLNGES